MLLNLPSRLMSICVAAFSIGAIGLGSARAAVVTFNPVEDSYLRGQSPNQNEGGVTLLRVQRVGPNRTVVRFDQAAIDAAVGGGVLTSATLELYVEFNQENWGSGREVDVHRMTQSWVEGGVTWNCPNDTNILNLDPDCPVQWSGGSFDATATGFYTQFNTPLTGVVSVDVTTDVNDFLDATHTNYGWMVKKRNEGSNGQVDYSSRESVTSSQRPVLRVDFIPPTSTPTSTPTETPTPTSTFTPTETSTPTPTETPTITPTPTPDPMCATLPLSGCLQSVTSQRSRLLLRQKANVNRNKMLYKWVKGEEVLLSDLGDPLSDEHYTMCVYGSSAGVFSKIDEAIIPPGGTCGNKPCWKSVKRGFKYRNRDASIGGVKVMIFKSGDEGRSKIVLRGKGSNLNLLPPLPQDPEVVVQIKNQVGTCWETRFSTNTANDAETFNAKGD